MDEQKKQLYAIFGIAVVLHVLLIVHKVFAWATLAAALAVLLVALWKATTGRRLGLNAALTLSMVVHAVGSGVALYMQATAVEEEDQLIYFQAPPPILQKNFDLAKRPEISEVQMEMLASLSPPDLPTDISAIADVSAVGSDLLGAVLPGTATLGAFSGAKAEELTFDQVEMVSLSETASPVQETMSLRQELLNVEDLDIGRYQAVIIQDP